jgi:hypothetical protein
MSKRKELTSFDALPPEQMEHLQTLVTRGEQGDASVLPEIQQMLDDHPEIWQRYGDLAGQAEEAWKRVIAGENTLFYESLGRKLDEFKAELTKDGNSPLERLLAQRISACWLQTQYADVTYAQTKNANLPQFTALMRRQTSSQHRLLQAIKTMATVRKLVKPVLSPIQIATGLRNRNTGASTIRRQTCVSNGAPVAN